MQESINKIRKYMKENIFVSVFFFCLSILTAVVAVFATEDGEHMLRILMICVPVVLAISAWLLAMGLRYRPVINELEKVKTEEVFSVTVTCIKVRNMRRSIGRRAPFWGTVKVLWCQEGGKTIKYYFIPPHQETVKRKEDPIYTSLRVYKGSSIIHSFNEMV